MSKKTLKIGSKKKDAFIALRISKSNNEALKTIAKKENMSKSLLIDLALRRHIHEWNQKN